LFHFPAILLQELDNCLKVGSFKFSLDGQRIDGALDSAESLVVLVSDQQKQLNITRTLIISDHSPCSALVVLSDALAGINAMRFAARRLIGPEVSGKVGALGENDSAIITNIHNNLLRFKPVGY
jgi:hypothetical protein